MRENETWNIPVFRRGHVSGGYWLTWLGKEQQQKHWISGNHVPKSLAWFKALGDSATCWNPFVLSWHKQGQTHSLLVESPVMRYVSSVFASKDRVSLTFMFRTFGFKKQPLSIKVKCWWFWLLYHEVLHFPQNASSLKSGRMSSTAETSTLGMFLQISQ